MSKIGLIIKREYLRRVTRKTFLLLTLLIPFLLAVLLFAPAWFTSMAAEEETAQTTAIMDASSNYTPLLEDTDSIHSSTIIASTIGGIFSFLIYIFVMLYGAMVLQGVTEEKANRIVEIIISSVKPFELMMGKIIGIGLVGLTQMFLWTVMAFCVFFYTSISMDLETLLSLWGNEWNDLMSSISFTEIGILFILYFIGGYLLYAAIFAAIGSAVDSHEDTQPFILPITLLLIFALYTGIYGLDNPDGSMTFWCSMFPLTSPIVMMVRIAFGVSFWEKLLSLCILYASAFAITWLSAKIYRVGILMYGKKPSLKEMVRWLRNDKSL